MVSNPRSLRARNAHPLWRRVYLRLAAWLGSSDLPKAHRVHFVRIGRGRFKRVEFAHASEATRIAENLATVASIERFPELVYQRNATVWVRYLHGLPLHPDRPEHTAAVIDFFAALYTSSSQTIDSGTASFHTRLLADLDFLGEVDLLPRALTDELTDYSETLRPPQLRVGFDYVDALLKNFLLCGDRAVGIDIESVYRNQLLGIGLAKARLRWLKLDEAHLLDALEARGFPHLRPQYAYATLCFLAGYGKQNVFRRKAKRVRARDFERLLNR